MEKSIKGWTRHAALGKVLTTSFARLPRGPVKIAPIDLTAVALGFQDVSAFLFKNVFPAGEQGASHTSYSAPCGHTLNHKNDHWRHLPVQNQRG